MKIEIGKTYNIMTHGRVSAENKFIVQALGQDGWYYGLWTGADGKPPGQPGRFNADGISGGGSYKLAPNIKKIKKYIAIIDGYNKKQAGAGLFDSEQAVMDYWNATNTYKIIKIVEVEWEEEE